MYKASLLHMIGLVKGRHSLSTVRKALRDPLEKFSKVDGPGNTKREEETEREMSTIYIHTNKAARFQSGY